MSQDFDADKFDIDGAISGPVSFDALSKVAQEMRDMEQNVAALEDALKLEKSRLHRLRTKVLPEMFAEAGVSSFELDDGTRLSMETLVNGSLPKDPERLDIAINHLRDIGGEELIRTEVTAMFSRGEHNMAMDFYADAEQRGLTTKMHEGVHPQTLKAFVREKLNGGDEIDPEKLGVYVSQIVKAK
jgi:hypothetical protein